MIELGKKYGVSRPTIKWACQEMGVPLPPQAYWVHRKRGHLMHRPELPRRLPNQLQAIGIATLLKHERPSRRSSMEQFRTARKRRVENARRIMEQEIQYAALIAEVDDWHRAESIRRYLAELDRRVADGGVPTDGYEGWRAMAEQYAGTIDASGSRIQQ